MRDCDEWSSIQALVKFLAHVKHMLAYLPCALGLVLPEPFKPLLQSRVNFLKSESFPRVSVNCKLDQDREGLRWLLASRGVG